MIIAVGRHGDSGLHGLYVEALCEGLDQVSFHRCFTILANCAHPKNFWLTFSRLRLLHRVSDISLTATSLNIRQSECMQTTKNESYQNNCTSVCVCGVCVCGVFLLVFLVRLNCFRMG